MIENFQNSSELFLKFLKIILTEELFEYLLKNDDLGKYFHVISSIINKYFEAKENKDFTETIYPELLINLKKIVNQILKFISQENLLLEKKYQEKDNFGKGKSDIENCKLSLIYKLLK